MFGIGGSEILVILVIALLFLGPDKLPEAAKQISKTVREIKKQGRVLTQTIENDEHIGGAIRDLKSALRGDEIPDRKPVKKAIAKAETPTIAKPEDLEKIDAKAAPEAEKPAELEAKAEQPAEVEAAKPEAKTEATADDKPAEKPAEKPTVTLPPTAGEADDDVRESPDDPSELAKLVKPAAGAIARDEISERKHG